MKPDSVDPEEWRNRCADRIIAIDQQIPRDEAQKIAQDLHAFERTRAMEPEAAADFVAAEMGRADRPRFERRGSDRPQHAPLKSLLRFFTPPGARAF